MIEITRGDTGLFRVYGIQGKYESLRELQRRYPGNYAYVDFSTDADGFPIWFFQSTDAQIF